MAISSGGIRTEIHFHKDETASVRLVADSDTRDPSSLLALFAFTTTRFMANLGSSSAGGAGLRDILQAAASDLSALDLVLADAGLPALTKYDGTIGFARFDAKFDTFTGQFSLKSKGMGFLDFQAPGFTVSAALLLLKRVVQMRNDDENFKVAIAGLCEALSIISSTTPVTVRNQGEVAELSLATISF